MADAKPMLTLRATVRRPGRRDQAFEISSSELSNPTPIQIEHEIDECFARLRVAVREELK